MQSAVVLQYPIKPSLCFAVSLPLLHIIVAAVLYATAMSVPVKLVMFLLIFLSLFYYLARDVLLLLPNSWREISLNQDSVSVTVQAGYSFLGQVANKTVVSPYFIVLCVRQEGHRLLVCRVIFPDALGAGAFRELCVHLKFA